MKTPLENKVVIVTGGTRGIGAAIVRRLAKEGAAVAFSYVSSAERGNALVREIEQNGGKALAVRADQADPAAARSFVHAVHERFGGLDIVVASAGLFASAQVGDATADWDAIERMLAVNVGGTAALVKAAVPKNERRRKDHHDRHHRRDAYRLCRVSRTTSHRRPPSPHTPADGRVTSAPARSPSTSSSRARFAPR